MHLNLFIGVGMDSNLIRAGEKLAEDDRLDGNAMRNSMSDDEFRLIGPETLHVIVFTPLGEGGHGGIDRIVDEVRRQVALVRPENLNLCYLATRGRGHIAFSLLYFGSSLLQLIVRRLLGRVDVLHVNLSSHGSTIRKVLICRAARMLNVPYIVHLHGSRFRQFYLDRGRFGTQEIVAMFRGAARVVVLGSVWQTFVAERMPEVTNRIEVLPNATRAPTKINRRSPGPVTILFLGQVGKRKGIPQLIDAFKSLAQLPGWMGVIAGDGDVDQTRAEIKRVGLETRVSLPGWADRAEVDRLLAEADILVLPSFDENLPMSVIEGMGYGLAVIATPVGAVVDIIKDGETGILIPAGDSVSLANALRRLITEADLRARLGDNARVFHRNHLSIDSYLPRLIGIWRAATVEQTDDALEHAR